MFEFATEGKTRSGVGRHGAAVIVSVAVHGALIFVATALAVAQTAPDETGPVDVKFVKPSSRAAAPPPPPPPKKKTTHRVPQKIVAPVVMPEKPPEQKPEEENPKEPEPDEDEGVAGGAEDGVEGGVVGGVAGGVLGGTLGGQLGGQVVDEEVPAYAGIGYTKPRLARANCLGETIHIPPDLHRVMDKVVVQFAVDRQGKVSKFKFLTHVPNPRIEEAVMRGIQACEWSAGTDAKGAPVFLWVVQPIKLL